MYQSLDSITLTDIKVHNSDVKLVFDFKGHAFAYAIQNELVVENFESKEKRRRYVCDSTIDFISWSPDSELICCGMFKKNLIQVWNTTDPSWRCKITEGHLKITGNTWAPDSRHLLVNCELDFKITIWSLVSIGFTVIENPKSTRNSISFSSCSKYMAVLESKEFSDCIGIYCCKEWQLLKYFPIEIENAAEIEFSPNELVIVVLAAVSCEYKVVFYSIDGRLLSTYCNPDSILGITTFSWSPKNDYILFGDYFEKISVLDGRRYKEICSFSLPDSTNSTKINFYRIIEKPLDLKHEPTSYVFPKWEFYEAVCNRPVSVLPPVESVKVKQKSPRSGIQMLLFSMDGQYAAIVCRTKPCVLFIFSSKTLAICDIIVQNTKIKNVEWHPKKSILAICSGNSSIDLWTSTCCIHLVSPYEDEFLIKNVEWCPSGDSIVLNGKEGSIILSFPLSSEETNKST